MNFQPVLTEAGKNPIEALAGEIQKLPAKIRWINSVPAVIQARACGTPVVMGPRSRIAALLLTLAALLGVAPLTARAGSFCLLANLYRRQAWTHVSHTIPRTIFIGIGALRETALQQAIEKERCEPVFFLNETEIDSFGSVLKVDWRELLDEWRAVTQEVALQLAGSAGVGIPSHNCRVEFLAQAHKFAYFRAWFRKLRSADCVHEPIVFSAASNVSAAAISAGFRAAYYLHGFQRQSLVYPDFEKVRAFTHTEGRHLARRLPHATVEVNEENSEPIATERVVAIAGCYGQTLGFDACAEFVEWARSESIPVIVRPHPLDESGFFERWRNDPSVTLVDSGSSFDGFLEKYRPRLVLSWFSTALFDALRRGVVPVIVETEVWRTLDVVFPFRDISLVWPAERDELLSVMANESERSAVLAKRRAIEGFEQRAETAR